MSKSKPQVVLTGYESRPESLSYFLHEMKSIRESRIFDVESCPIDGEEEIEDREEGEVLVHSPSPPLARQR